MTTKKSIDVDIDAGIFGIAQYGAKDEESTGEGHPEDETTGGAGKLATRVEPNPKCMGCMQYDNTRGVCTVALYPTSCGDGSKPETGYAPLVPNAVAYEEWQKKKGLAHNAPTANAQADGVPAYPAGPEFKTQVLGDEGYLALSLAEAAYRRAEFPALRDALLVKSAAQTSNGSYQMARRKRGGYTITHRSNEGAMTTIGYYPTETHATGAAMAHYKKKSMAAKDPDVHCPRCGEADLKKNNVCKCGYSMKSATLRSTVAYSDENEVGGPVSKGAKKPKVFPHAGKLSANNKLPRKPGAPHIPKVKKSDEAWAIAGAAWKKVGAKKKAEYVQRAMARHAEAGESVKAEQYAHQAPREFVARLAADKSEPFVVEFGPDMVADLMRARHAVRKAVAAMAQPKPAQGQSPILAAVRARQMRSPSAGSKVKAKQAGGGKEFPHGKLAEAAGVKPEEVAAHAHQAPHVSAFVNKVRSSYGDKVKHVTDGQIRSAYHSTGLMHSMTSNMNKGGSLKWEHPASGSGLTTSRGRPTVTVRGQAHGSYLVSKTPKGFHASHLPAGGGAAHKLGTHSTRDAAVRSAEMHHAFSSHDRHYGAAKKSLAKSFASNWKGGKNIQSHGTYSSARGGLSHTKVNAGKHMLTYRPKGSGTSKLLGQHASFADAHRQAGEHHMKMSKTQKSLAITPDDLDLIKSHKLGKRHVIGHTSTGKPVHSDAHGAEGYNEEEHDEAREMHQHLSDRVMDASYGMGSGMHSTVRGQATPAARKYLKAISDHHSHIARRHSTTANAMRDARWKKENGERGPSKVDAPEPFNKSEGIQFSNNPTDSEIAAGMMTSGGAGMLAESGQLNAPMNARPGDTTMHTLSFGGVPGGEVIELIDVPKEAKVAAPMVGGVPSSAWDMGQHRG